MGKDEIIQFLDFLASDRNVTTNTQPITLDSLMFLYSKILKQPVTNMNFRLAKKPCYLPTVLSGKEAILIIEQLKGVHQLIVKMMYGSDLRISEALGLRIQDIDFNTNSVAIPNGKGNKNRVTLLSQNLKSDLYAQIEKAVEVQQKDNKDGIGPSLPDTLSRKYLSAFRQVNWMFIFSSVSTCHQSVNNRLCRHHLHTSVIRKALRRAKEAANIHKRVTCHTFRHSFMKRIPALHPMARSLGVQINSRLICATHLLEAGTDIRTVQELLGHTDVKTTAYGFHIIGKHYAGTSSPLDRTSERRASYA